MDVVDRLQRAKVYVEIGWTPEAELELSRLLNEHEDDLDALSLLAKVKHLNGELSQAMACWTRIRAHASHLEHARSQLAALVRLASGSGAELVCRDPAARWAVPHRELLQALAWLHVRRPDLARAHCAVIASRHREHDRHVYKLARIACAWIAEMTGDHGGARCELEQLATEPGYALDLDRLLALARVYERLGGPEALDAAARIYRHLLGELEARGQQRLSLLRRLASIEEQAGRFDAARELHARFVAGLRRRMHRPQLRDLVEVAAREYIPLERLRAVANRREELPPALGRREQALAAAIRGDSERAHMGLSSDDDRLARRYRAQLLASDGRLDMAAETFLSTVDVLDRPAAEWLLDHAAIPAVAAYWDDEEHRRVAGDLLDEALAIAPRRAETWRRRATLHAIGREHEHAARCTARALALDQVARARAAPVGRVLAASVCHIQGTPKGVLHELWVHREPTTPGRGGTLDPDAIHGNVTPELRAMIRNAFVAVREYARARFPEVTAAIDDFTYSIKLPKEDEPSGGVSAGLPAALAFLSTFLQRPVPFTVASSGMLITEAHDVITIGRIGDPDHKVKAACHRNLRWLILPAANRLDLDDSSVIPREIADEVVHYVDDLDGAMRLVFGPDVFTRP